MPVQRLRSFKTLHTRLTREIIVMRARIRVSAKVMFRYVCLERGFLSELFIAWWEVGASVFVFFLMALLVVP